MKTSDLLSACFTCGPNRLTAVDAIGGSLTWERLIRRAAEELVLPALLGRIKHFGVEQKTPAEVADFLAAAEELNGDRNHTIFAELGAAALLLNRVGIEPVLLKGAAYCATGVYPNPAARYLWDVDFLIPEEQFSAAVSVLAENGFESDPNDRLGYFRHHYPPMRRNGSVSFELHRNLGMGACRTLLSAAEVLRWSISLDFQGAKVRVPSPEHLATHLIMHSQIQHPYHERIWPPLRAMFDLVLIRQRFDGEIDWRAIERSFLKAKKLGVLELHLRQVQESLGAEIPFPVTLSGLTYFRWLRRRLLRKLPALRFADPIYMCSTVFARRLRLLQNALNTPGGWRHIASELSVPSFYRRLITDIIEGYGR